VADANNCLIRGTPLSPGVSPQVIKSVNHNTGNALVFTWSAMVGHTYQVQYKTNLNKGTWNSLTNVVAPSWTGIASIPVGAEAQRFYRVVLLP